MGSLKDLTLGGDLEKPIYMWGLPKKGRLGQFVDLRGAWQERGGGVFLRGLVPQCQCPLCQCDLVPLHVKDQFICELFNNTLQTDILAKAGHLQTLEQLIAHAEAFETAL